MTRSVIGNRSEGGKERRSACKASRAAWSSAKIVGCPAVQSASGASTRSVIRNGELGTALHCPHGPSDDDGATVRLGASLVEATFANAAAQHFFVGCSLEARL